jgi:hypothetical protein
MMDPKPSCSPKPKLIAGGIVLASILVLVGLLIVNNGGLPKLALKKTAPANGNMPNPFTNQLTDEQKQNISDFQAQISAYEVQKYR